MRRLLATVLVFTAALAYLAELAAERALRALLRLLADLVMSTNTARSAGPGPHLPVIEAAAPGRCVYADCQRRPDHPVHGSAGRAVAVALAVRRPS